MGRASPRARQVGDLADQPSRRVARAARGGIPMNWTPERRQLERADDYLASAEQRLMLALQDLVDGRIDAEQAEKAYELIHAGRGELQKLAEQLERFGPVL